MDTNQRICFALIALLALGFLNLIGADDPDENQQRQVEANTETLSTGEYQRIYEQIFSEDGGQTSLIAPEETAELLKRLNGVRFDFRIWDLIAINNPQEEDLCSTAHVYNLIHGYGFHSHRPNIVAYLNHHAEKQFSLCRDNFMAKLKEAIGKLGEQTTKDLNLLAEVFNVTAETNPGSLKVKSKSLEEISRGVLKFFELRDPVQFKLLRRKFILDSTILPPERKEFTQKVIASFLPIVQEIIKPTRAAADFYWSPAITTIGLDKVEQFGHEWLPKLSLVLGIHYELSHRIDSLHTTMVKMV